MRNKDIKRILRERAEKTELPDMSEEILARAHHVVRVEKAHRRFRWIYPAVGVAVAAVIAVFFLFSPVVNIIGGNTLTVSKKEEVFSKELLALGNLVTGVETVGGDEMLRLGMMRPVDAEDAFGKTACEEMAAEIHRYLLTGNALLAQNQIAVQYEKNKDEAYSSYAFRMTVSFRDDKGFLTEYLCYYNEEEDDSPEEKEMEGVLLIGGKAYSMEGEREIEEDEVELEITVHLNGHSYISISNETEINENEYEYVFVENGKVVKGVSLEVNTEDGISETELEIIENGKTVSMTLTYEKDRILCEYQGEKEADIVVEVKDTSYVYVFEEGVRVEIKK